MRIAPAILLLALAAPSTTYSQTTMAELRQDFVKVLAGKMVAEEFGLYTLSLPGRESLKLQIKMHSEAPATGLISRDNFVSYTTSIAMLTLIAGIAEELNVTASQLLGALDYLQLRAPIGTPDVELNIRMTTDGLQIEVVDTSNNTKKRKVLTWAEVLGPPKPI
jgi:hypothetical protein